MNVKSGFYSLRPLLVRIISLFAAAALALGSTVWLSFAAGAQADYRYYYDDFWYIIDVSSGKFTASIVGFEPSAEHEGKTDAAIPSTIGENKYEVTSVGANAFSGTNITSVSMPGSVKAIGEGAFRGCTALTTVNIPSSVETISDYAFYGCTAMKNINLPGSITKIGYEAFMNCTSLETITISEGLKLLDRYAFTNCTSLKEIKLPNSTTGIGTGAFEGCTSLKKVELPKDLLAIEDFVFHNCSLLPGITLPEKLASIGNRAFSDCISLASINIPGTVQAIGWQAFYNCTDLSAVMIAYTTENISDTAFANTNAEIWGYTGSYAQSYAYRNNIPFHTSGEVHTVTFSADNLYASLQNISIKKLNGDIVNPPATVENGSSLSITATAPDGYDISYMTINGYTFANGSVYTVDGRDVSIFVSYKPKAVTAQSETPSPFVTSVSSTRETTPPPPVTTSTSASTEPEVTTSLLGDDTTSELTPDDEEPIDIDPSDDETTEPADDGSSDQYIKVDSDLQDVNGEKVRIVTQKDYFLGAATVSLTNSPESYAAAKDAVDSIETGESIYYAFDISILDEQGRNNPGYLARGSVTFQIPVPNELLPYADNIRVYHIDDDTPELIQSSIVTDINGVKRVVFDADSFSPYLFIAELDESVPVIDDADTTAPAVITPDDTSATGGGENITDDNSGSDEPKIIDEKTPDSGSRPSYNNGLNPHTGVIIGVTVPAAALVSVLLVRSNRKRKRTRTTIH